MLELRGPPALPAGDHRHEDDAGALGCRCTGMQVHWGAVDEVGVDGELGANQVDHEADRHDDGSEAKRRGEPGAGPPGAGSPRAGLGTKGTCSRIEEVGSEL